MKEIDFGSICSGIEAASVAFGPLGWKARWFSEIEKFPCAVLAHHYPDVPNLGNMLEIEKDERFIRTKLNVLCGGTPCQSFSIAGLRKGLTDDRGNLSLRFCQIARIKKSRWIIWENVPGILSDKGNAFGCFLAGLSGADEPLMPGTTDGRWGRAGIVSGPGYGLAWRIPNAEFFGVPQSRRRIFVVGYLGDWRPAAAVLFESKMLRGDIAEGEGEKKKVARDVIPCLRGGGSTPASHGKRSGTDRDHLIIMATGQGGAEILEGRVPTLNCNHEAPIVFENHGQDSRIKEVDTLPQINAKAGTGGGNLPLVMAFEPGVMSRCGGHTYENKSGTLRKNPGDNQMSIIQGLTVRRLTPMECERAQGFPDNYTQIPYKGKSADKCPDGPRYKAIGNSWAVPCAAWIGKRIQQFEENQ